MQAYTGFAKVYDTFMEEMPYDLWANYVALLLAEHGIKDQIVLDLGCGTGSMTRRLASYGYDMIGLDSSQEMLSIAEEKKEPGAGILYTCQDMRDFELYGTVAAVVSICDTINYVTDEEELCQVFCLVNNYLDPGGLFLFDIKSEYFFEQVLGDSTFAENLADCSLIWENYFDEKERINQYELTIYVKSGSYYERLEETHYQKAYKLTQIKHLLQKAGLVYIAAYGELTKLPPGEECQRMFILARESGKGNGIDG